MGCSGVCREVLEYSVRRAVRGTVPCAGAHWVHEGAMHSGVCWVWSALGHTGHSGVLREVPGAMQASPVAQMVRKPPASAGDLGSLPGSGRSPGGGHGNPLQCSCLENSWDRGAWRATVHGVGKGQTRLSDSHS